MASKINKNVVDNDDWETDPDYENDVSEQTQRWGGRQREAGKLEYQYRRNICLEYCWLSKNTKSYFDLKVLLIWINFGKIY